MSCLARHQYRAELREELLFTQDRSSATLYVAVPD